MNKELKVVRTMNGVRIIAAAMVVLAAVLYFTAREYALYPAVVGFALIALINLPLNIWLALQREKMQKREREKYEAGRKGKKVTDTKSSDEPLRYKDRKSGLKWGGGNIHAANADRQSRKKFLR
jgi:hypothetical protein